MISAQAGSRSGMGRFSSVVLSVAVCTALAACGGGARGTRVVPTACATTRALPAVSAPPGSGSWPAPNGTIDNARVAPHSTISSTNVDRLREAWTFKLSGSAALGVGRTGSLASNPIVQNGVVYLQDLDSNVYALALASGRLEWEYRCNEPVRSGPGPNGVAVADGRVYGATPTSVFALSAATGKPIWVNGHVLSSGQGTFGIQPQAADGRVYLASQYGIAPGGGVLITLNAATGALLWKFNTVLRPDPGVESLGAGSGGAWETPLVSGDGSVTFGTGNPYQTPASAIAHPAAQLYTNSDVNLDAATGKLRWYYQGVPNDFKDYDMQASPISASVGGAPVVIGGGKMGYVYEMDARTGSLMWKTAVGKHNGHDNDSLDALEHHSPIRAPYTILPGSLGGVLANMALAGHTIYVVTIDLPLTYTSLNQPAPTKVAGAYGGEIEALNLITGKVRWDTRVPSLPLGAATVSNDLLFTTLLEGELLALDRQTGAIVYRSQLPASVNAPVAIAGNTVIVPAGGPGRRPEQPQVVAYTVR